VFEIVKISGKAFEKDMVDNDALYDGWSKWKTQTYTLKQKHMSTKV